MRARTEVVDRSCRNGMACTVPPQPRTTFAPTMRSNGQSPPFTSTSGRQHRIRSSGVSSSNQVDERHGLQCREHGHAVLQPVDRAILALVLAL